MDKKNSYKFTIQFDPRLKEQKEAADFLNSLGRKKAEIIASAIACYKQKTDVEAERAIEVPQQKDIELISIDSHSEPLASYTSQKTVTKKQERHKKKSKHCKKMLNKRSFLLCLRNRCLIKMHSFLIFKLQRFDIFQY